MEDRTECVASARLTPKPTTTSGHTNQSGHSSNLTRPRGVRGITCQYGLASFNETRCQLRYQSSTARTKMLSLVAIPGTHRIHSCTELISIQSAITIYVNIEMLQT
jgi:hypothetical protein